MSWYKYSQISNRLIGYKIVAWDGKRAFSIYNPGTIYSLQVGSEVGQTYLGTNEQFCKDYYSGLTNFEDMLLTYSYNAQDVISGGVIS